MRTDGEGRIVIPREVRDKLGLKKGDNLVLNTKDNEIVLTMFET